MHNSRMSAVAVVNMEPKSEGIATPRTDTPGKTGIELANSVKQRKARGQNPANFGLASGLLVLNSGWQFIPKPFVGGILRDKIWGS